MKMLVFVILCLSLVFSGCSFLVGFPEKLWGTSTQELIDSKPSAATRLFDRPVAECIQKVKAAIVLMEAEVFLEKPGFVVAINFPGVTDTTRVAIFFDSLEAGTKISVVSLNSELQKNVSEKLFEMLESGFLEKEEGKLN